MKGETILEQLMKEANYAQEAMSRDLLFETYGKAKMARQLEVITFREFMDINEMTVYFVNTHAKELEHAERETLTLEPLEKLPKGGYVRKILGKFLIT